MWLSSDPAEQGTHPDSPLPTRQMSQTSSTFQKKQPGGPRETPPHPRAGHLEGRGQPSAPPLGPREDLQAGSQIWSKAPSLGQGRPPACTTLLHGRPNLKRSLRSEWLFGHYEFLGAGNPKIITAITHRVWEKLLYYRQFSTHQRLEADTPKGCKFKKNIK